MGKTPSAVMGPRGKSPMSNSPTTPPVRLCRLGNAVATRVAVPTKDSLIHSTITYERKINSSTLQGERTEARAQKDGGTTDGGTDTVGESQEGSGRTVNGVDRLSGRPGQIQVPEESRSDVSAHSFWKRGTTAIFDIRIVNLNAGSYLRIMPEKALVKAEKENKGLCL